MHKYSKPFVPVSDTLLELLYYWVFAAIIAWEVSARKLDLETMPRLGLRVFAVMEICNAKCHWMLRTFRTENKGKGAAYILPKGFLFDWVSCPHYTCEILAWASFASVVRSAGSIAFAFLGAIIMIGYAKERHDRYKTQFLQYPKSRGMLVPLDRFVV